MRILISLFLVFFLFLGSGLAETADRLLLLKSKRTLLLLKNGEILRAYRVALGRKPTGHKLMEGDKRTPEGIYFIDAKNPKSNFHLGLKISYPNEKDLAEAKSLGLRPGGMIMIHGLPKDMVGMGKAHRDQDWTDGCIAVTNHEIEEIWSMVEEGTPIEIRP